MRLLETPTLKIPGAVGTTHCLMRMRLRLVLCSVVTVAIMSAEVYGQQEKSRTKSRPKTSVSASSVDSKIASIIDADTRHEKKQQPATRAVSRATVDSSSSWATDHQAGDGVQVASFQTVSEPVVESSASPAKSIATVEKKTPALFLDLTGEAEAAEPTETPKSASAGSAEVTLDGNPSHVLMRAVAWIVIALCVFSLAALGIRWWQRQRGLLPTSNSRSRVIETLSVGPGRTVSLIELAGFRALVAADASGIRQLVLAPPSFHDEISDAEDELTDKPESNLKFTLPMTV